MLRELFSFSTRRKSSRFSRGFLFLVLLLFVPSTAIWFFYRSLFQADASIGGMVALSAMTAWIWAYLIGYGNEQHTAEIAD